MRDLMNSVAPIWGDAPELHFVRPDCHLGMDLTVDRGDLADLEMLDEQKAFPQAIQYGKETLHAIVDEAADKTTHECLVTTPAHAGGTRRSQALADRPRECGPR